MAAGKDVEEHVRRLWRHRGLTPGAPRRGPRPQFDLDAVLDAAVAVADAEGLGGVSTRAVGARLGVSAMTLYPYVGSKEQLVALMHDHASTCPSWTDPGPDLAADLRTWAEQLFALYLTHPWLAAAGWADAPDGPNEQDWSERLLGVLDRRRVPPAARTAVVTVLYATVRAAAQTAARYRELERDGGARQWWERAVATRRLIADHAQRYPLATALPPAAPDWRDAPLAAVRRAVDVLARGLR